MSVDDAFKQFLARHTSRRRGPTPEALVQRDIEHFLASQFWFFYRSKNQGTIQQTAEGAVMKAAHAAGLPDLTGILPGGRALYIEVKAGKGRVTPEQRRFLEDAAYNGALAFVARSVEDVQEACAEYLKPDALRGVPLSSNQVRMVRKAREFQRRIGAK